MCSWLRSKYNANDVQHEYSGQLVVSRPYHVLSFRISLARWQLYARYRVTSWLLQLLPYGNADALHGVLDSTVSFAWDDARVREHLEEPLSESRYVWCIVDLAERRPHSCR
jgi:hypothetical protein